MHYKQFLQLIIALLLITSLFSLDNTCKSNLKKIESIAEQSFGLFDVNRITSDFSNDGYHATYLKSGKSGMLFDGKSIIYNSGFWVADSSNNGLRISTVEYSTEFVPGAFGLEYDPSIHGILTNDASKSNLGDQSHWYIYNDVSSHNIYQTDPLNLELESTIWGYQDNYSSIKLQNVMFVKTRITNKGTTNLVNVYIGLWVDPDLGNAGDDFVGCDSTLNLGYCYNDSTDNVFGENTPCVGAVLLKGPIEQTLGKVSDNESIMRMTSFVKYT